MPENAGSATERALAELEAESVAFIVCEAVRSGSDDVGAPQRAERDACQAHESRRPAMPAKPMPVLMTYIAMA